MKVLLTGFVPFDHRNLNASSEIVSRFQTDIPQIEIIKAFLPVVYKPEVFLSLFEQHKDCDLFLFTGEASGRDYVSLEAVGLNVMNASIPDNDGVLKTGEGIIKDGPNAYFSNLDLIKLNQAIDSSKLRVSYHAGTYICNLMYYLGLHFIDTHQYPVSCLFIHFPTLEHRDFSVEDGCMILEKVLTYLK